VSAPSISLRFWGVRGSIPCPGPTTVIHGGNTSCLELRFGPERRLVIVDAGTGLRELGNELMRTDLPKGPIRTKLFLTHTHWDHIMGFPFFTPVFVPGTELTVYGPVTYEDDPLDVIVGGQLTYRYFPVRQDQLAAKLDYANLKEGVHDLGDGLVVKTKYLNHPILVLGYRFEYAGKCVCTAYDTEPFRNVFAAEPDDPGYDAEAVRIGEEAAREENQKITEFFRGADLLVHDTQYTTKEYATNRRDWGHSTYEYAINAANRAGVRKLLLFHHDPLRTDEELIRFERIFRRALRGKSDMDVLMAREGMTVEV
jgi:phosphoribosyl 1,2-cyclic phosphodiesterase